VQNITGVKKLQGQNVVLIKRYRDKMRSNEMLWGGNVTVVKLTGMKGRSNKTYRVKMLQK
jgi:hypothetical protein